MVTNNYCLVKPIKPSDQRASGLVLTKRETGTERFGYILDVGIGICDIYGNSFKPDLDIGDLVYFSQHAPERIDYSDVGLPEDLFIISEGDIYTKVKLATDGTINLLPMGNYIHVEPLEDSVSDRTPGGLYLPERVLERPTKGKVVAVGPGQRTAGPKYYMPNVDVGDIIRFRKHSMFEIDLKDVAPSAKNQFIIPFGDTVFIERKGWETELKKRLKALDE